MNSSHSGLVHSSHGNALIDIKTGEILRVDLHNDGDPSVFADIKRFDLAEYWAFYGYEPGSHTSFDILDLGFWDKEGVYEPADQWFRMDVFRNQRDEALEALRRLAFVINRDDDGDYFICAEASACIDATNDILKRHGRMNG